jgi:hypothetical protein
VCILNGSSGNLCIPYGSSSNTRVCLTRGSSSNWCILHGPLVTCAYRVTYLASCSYRVVYQVPYDVQRPTHLFLLFLFMSQTQRVSDIPNTAAQRGLRPPSFTRFLDHTQRRAKVGRNPLDEWSARRRDLYLTTHTTDKHPCPRWDSNRRSQQASGRRPTSLTARPLGPASSCI